MTAPTPDTSPDAVAAAVLAARECARTSRLGGAIERAAGSEAQADLIEALASELGEYRKSFDLRWKADHRAIAAWQRVGEGRELTWPDHADLCLWLLAERDQLTAERDAALARAETAERAADVYSKLAAAAPFAVPAVALGDTMQSEGSRMAVWLDGRADVPYEVRLAAAVFRNLEQRWTAMRTAAPVAESEAQP